MKKFAFYKQRDESDCGPSCLKMITGYWGKNFSIQKLRALCSISAGGVTMLDISEAAEKLGLRTLGVKLSVSRISELDLPCILHWRQNHFVVLYKIKKGKFYIADPDMGFYVLNEQELTDSWFSNDDHAGNALMLNPTPDFFKQNDDKNLRLNWSFITKYLFAYKQLLVQLIMALAIGSALQLIVPFLTQIIVDVGINTRDIAFINIILFAQLMLFAGSASVDFMRSWILLHISTRVNISILTDFLIKIMKLPISFFDTKTTGDIMQRIQDEKRIESFLTGSTLNIAFSAVNFLIFSVVIFFYSLKVFLISTLGTILYITWIVAFLNRRRKIDYKQFNKYAQNQDNLFEIVRGIQDIKLNGVELKRRWKWEHIQASLFRLNTKTLALDQYQQAGGLFLSQSKNIIITYLCARAVINGELTLGAMLAIQYITGQLNAPVEHFIEFIKSFQSAKISIERLNEIHKLEDEENPDKEYIDQLPEDKSIRINNLTFTYPGAGNLPVLKNINLVIPEGKTTAIVGMSGSGKTTIMKLLLRFYEPDQGVIHVGNVSLNDIRHRLWRNACSTVMQDGYIFNDTLVNNICLNSDELSQEKLNKVIEIANINDIIDDLPYGLQSRIGERGKSVSQGQKQRILIGRAIYKEPQYLFLDEATNSLDAKNERMIVDHLSTYLKGKTVVVIAHRLSTVKNADNIIVLNKGEITEQGSHQKLLGMQGEYFNLIKNQLELGN